VQKIGKKVTFKWKLLFWSHNCKGSSDANRRGA